MGYDVQIAWEHDGANDAIADGLLTMLNERGVNFDSPGHPVVMAPNIEPATTADILRPASAERHTMSAILRVVADANINQLKAAGDDRDNTRLLSAGGPNAIKSLTALAGLKPTHFADEGFTEML